MARGWANYVKKEPPGLSRGSDDRGLGAKRDPPLEETEEKGPKGNQYLKETDSHTTERMKTEEMNHPHYYPWTKWTDWLYSEPESYGSFGWNELPRNNWSGKGQGSKGEPQPKTDPGGLIYEPSTWALKASERSPVGHMPLLFEFTSYSTWEPAARRWNNLLYNHPVSSVIEYYINNLKESPNILNNGAGDFLKNQFRKKQDQNEKSLALGEDFEKIGYEWMFRILKEKYQERPGEAIRRVTLQLENINQVIYQELAQGIQDPEGVWDWLSKKRDDLQSLGRNLTNREIYDYFIKCKIVSEYPYFNVIRTHCLTVEFVGDLEGLEWELFQKKFAGHLNILENMVNTDSKRKKFGSAEIYNGTTIPTSQSFNRVPGSRWTNTQKGKGKAKGTGVQRNNRGVNWTETVETNFSEENNLYSGQEGGGRILSTRRRPRSGSNAS